MSKTQINVVMFLSMLLSVTTIAHGQSDQPTAESESVSLLQRVCVIGASASDGYNVEHTARSEDKIVTRRQTISSVLAKATSLPDVDIHHHGDFLFFTNPVDHGRRQVDEALKDEPTLVVALDFLFWHGYGSINVNRRLLRKESERMKLLEEGLKQLERFDCPVVISEFPDMSTAVGRMLSAQQMPARATLKKLNERVRIWVAEQDNVHVCPMREFAAAMVANKPYQAGELRWPEEVGRSMIQEDRLHPTLEGLVALSQLVLQTLEEAALITSDQFEKDAKVILHRIEQDMLKPALIEKREGERPQSNQSARSNGNRIHSPRSDGPRHAHNSRLIGTPITQLFVAA